MLLVWHLAEWALPLGFWSILAVWRMPGPLWGSWWGEAPWSKAPAHFCSPLLAGVVPTLERHMSHSALADHPSGQADPHCRETLIAVPAEELLYKCVRIDIWLLFCPPRDGERWASLQCTLSVTVADPQWSSDTICVAAPAQCDYSGSWEHLCWKLLLSASKDHPCSGSPMIPVITKPFGDHCRLERNFCRGAGYPHAQSLYEKWGVKWPWENLFLYQAQSLWVLLTGCHQVSRGWTCIRRLFPWWAKEVSDSAGPISTVHNL